jgi:hypothetical protein
MGLEEKVSPRVPLTRDREVDPSAATLTASVPPTILALFGSKRPNEEANPKQSLCEEDSAFAPGEAREFQTH